MSDKKQDLQYRCIIVGERPFCIWDWDIKEKTLDFIENIEPSFFEYVANIHNIDLEEVDETTGKEFQLAAITIRTIYSQAIETLFALLCALIQAPQCIPAWMTQYKLWELRRIIYNIQNSQPILSKIKADVPSWKIISDIVFQSLILEDKDLERIIKDNFAGFWSKIAQDFLDDGFNEEYNSIKHGFRVRIGGFQVAIGLQENPNEIAPKEKMRLIGKSQFGSHYLSLKEIGQFKYHLALIENHRNWNPEDMCWRLKLICMSIKNVQSMMKIMNGIPAEKVKYEWPSDMESFNECWKRSKTIGVTSMSGFTIPINEEFILPFTKEDIAKLYQDGKDYGTRQINFRNNQVNS